jgi:murein DD-endopeptidase MepM/ murein hydrolase activator NlpD
MLKNQINCIAACFLSLFIVSCSSPGKGIFGKKTPHEQYEKKIKESGKENPLTDAWLKTAAITLSTPLDISLPYSESGYFPDEKANGIGLRFRARRGQKLKIALTKKGGSNLVMYIDLWQPYPTYENKTPRFLSAADTSRLILEHIVNEDTAFIVRIQPELLKEGEYTLSITAGPSLTFPIASSVKSNIGSFWGDGRDNGGRKHEGIDIIAPKLSPAIAAANGLITRVNENALGGKVIYLHPDNAPYTLYYAHLDSQIAKEGQRVNAGDIIGLTGNTGNAKFTVSHLHFGIYMNNAGAVDPLYYVKNDYKKPPVINVALTTLNTWMRSAKNAKLFSDQNMTGGILLDENTLMRTEAATGSQYRVVLPDGKKGFVAATALITMTKPIKKLSLKNPIPLLATPNTESLTRKMLSAGDKINVLAAFRDYYFVDMNNVRGWILKGEL